MTESMEALKRLYSQAYLSPMSYILKDFNAQTDYDTVTQALKRNEPMKVVTAQVKIKHKGKERVIEVHYCGKCDYELALLPYAQYCPECGLALDREK